MHFCQRRHGVKSYDKDISHKIGVVFRVLNMLFLIAYKGFFSERKGAMCDDPADK